MSSVKELWIAECERICENYRNGEMSREAAIGRLHQLGWDRDAAADKLEEWADA